MKSMRKTDNIYQSGGKKKKKKNNLINLKTERI